MFYSFLYSLSDHLYLRRNNQQGCRVLRCPVLVLLFRIPTFSTSTKGTFFITSNSSPSFLQANLRDTFCDTSSISHAKSNSGLRIISNRSFVYCCYDWLNNSVCEGAFFYVVGNTPVITEILHLMCATIIESFMIIIF